MSDDTHDDIILAQLMASRLCHDLVGTLGAVSAGLEVMGEGASSGAVDQDAFRLAAKSADQMTRKLMFMRVAFGAGLSGGTTPLAEARGLTEALLTGTPVTLDWQEDAAIKGLSGAPEGGLLAKLLLNLVLIGVEALHRGGTLRVRAEGNGKALTLRVEAEGERLAVKEGLAEAILAGTGENPQKSGLLEGLSARSVQGYFCGRLARLLGGGMRLVSGKTGLTLEAGPLRLTS